MKLPSWFRRKKPAETASPRASFEPCNDLEVALIAAAHEPGARGDFQKLLLASELYVATPQAPSRAGDRTLAEGEMLQILNVAGQDGEPVPALFTDESRLAAAFGTGTGYVRMPAATLLEMIAEDGAILNPGEAYGVLWSKEEILQMLGKPVQRRIEKDTRIMLGVPAKRPDALIERIGEIVADAPAIAEVWLALAHWPEDDQSSWFLDIRSTADPDTVAALLHDVLRSGPYEGLPIDLVVNQPGGEPGAGIRIKPAELH